MIVRIVRFVAAAACLVALAGCGGNAGTAGSGAASTTPTRSTGTSAATPVAVLSATGKEICEQWLGYFQAAPSPNETLAAILADATTVATLAGKSATERADFTDGVTAAAAGTCK